MTEFARLYEGLCRGAAVDSAEDLSYRDALADVPTARERGRDFWVDYLAHFDAPLPLERYATSTAPANAVAVQPVERLVALTREQTAALTAALGRAELTVASAVAAWFALALCANCEQRDLLIGLVTSGRQGERARYRDTVGNLIGTVPLRATLNRGRTLRRWTQGIQHTIAQLQQYERTSPQEIKRWIGRLGPQPLFDALFVHECFGKPEVLFGTATGLRIECSRFTVNEGYPLVLVAHEGECLNLTLRYLPQACPEEFAQALLERLVRLCTRWPDASECDVVDVASAPQ